MPSTPAPPSSKPDFAYLIKHGKGLAQSFEWPQDCGNFTMRIDSDGLWYYQNSPIGRKELSQLFATTLQRDTDGAYWVVTPFERGPVMVDDVPFVIVELDYVIEDNQQVIYGRTTLDFWVRFDADHPFMVTLNDRDEPRPYILIRDTLYARLNRNCFYEMVHKASTQMNHNGDEIFIAESANYACILGALPSDT